ncbi:hypothetical protein AVEN_7076-1 [Araneus ventricosus]|uniref:Uncharacterized protein n=1 Tax=Araneus ventricosus TaxID=182803 RepID=A0A4Y2KVA3_ARAVE|nr:hypothetical protein AVEN_7076-1 [Araneus ventricosus]
MRHTQISVFLLKQVHNRPKLISAPVLPFIGHRSCRLSREAWSINDLATYLSASCPPPLLDTDLCLSRSACFINELVTYLSSFCPPPLSNSSNADVIFNACAEFPFLLIEQSFRF